MNKKLIRKLFPLVAILLLTPCPIAYANNIDTMASGDSVQIEIAEPSDKPSYTAFGKAIGGVTPGDLFYIDTAASNADIVVSLHLTNSSELMHNYRYLILKVGVYIDTGSGIWDKALSNNGDPILDTFITMRNGQVSFVLAGLARYKIAIDGGSFYSFTVDSQKGNLSPQFYLTVDQV